jgi:hypothetical protein
MRRLSLVVALASLLLAPSSWARPETPPAVREQARALLAAITPDFHHMDWKLATQATREARLRLLAQEGLDEVDRTLLDHVKVVTGWDLSRHDSSYRHSARQGMYMAARLLLELVASDEPVPCIQLCLERALALGVTMVGTARRFFYWNVRYILHELDKAGFLPEDVSRERELLEKAYYELHETRTSSYEAYYGKLLEFVVEHHGVARPTKQEEAPAPRQKSRLRKFAELFGRD